MENEPFIPRAMISTAWPIWYSQSSIGQVSRTSFLSTVLVIMRSADSWRLTPFAITNFLITTILWLTTEVNVWDEERGNKHCGIALVDYTYTNNSISQFFNNLIVWKGKRRVIRSGIINRSVRVFLLYLHQYIVLVFHCHTQNSFSFSNTNGLLLIYPYAE